MILTLNQLGIDLICTRCSHSSIDVKFDRDTLTPNVHLQCDLTPNDVTTKDIARCVFKDVTN